MERECRYIGTSEHRNMGCLTSDCMASTQYKYGECSIRVYEDSNLIVRAEARAQQTETDKYEM
jgi:hypothetical protein